MKNIGPASLISYVSFTLIFFIMKNKFGFPGTSWIWFFLIITGIVQFINNLYITKYPEICGRYNVNSALTATIVPWIFIFGLSCICLVFIPGWLRVFSNTFGVAIATMGGLNVKVNNLFTKPMETTEATETTDTRTQSPDRNKTISETINLLYANRTKFINEVDISDYSQSADGKITWNSLQNIMDFMKISLENKNQQMKELYELLVIKEDAGYFAWFILIGSISILVSTNSLLLTTCNSVEFNF
jgi:hypothetical protein